MKTYETQIEIDATPPQVWQTLTQSMPKSPTSYGIVRLDGDIALGAKLKLWSEVTPKRAFVLRVAQYEPPNSMIWKGGMPFGLFTGTRRFSLTAKGTGTVFQMREEFNGPLAGMITKSMPDLTPSFTKFANALKQEAEKS